MPSIPTKRSVVKLYASLKINQTIDEYFTIIAFLFCKNIKYLQKYFNEGKGDHEH